MHDPLPYKTKQNRNFLQKKKNSVFLSVLRGLFGAVLQPLQLGCALLVPAGKQGLIRQLQAAGKAPVQPVTAGQLVALEHAAAHGIAGTGTVRAPP